MVNKACKFLLTVGLGRGCPYGLPLFALLFALLFASPRAYAACSDVNGTLTTPAPAAQWLFNNDLTDSSGATLHNLTVAASGTAAYDTSNQIEGSAALNPSGGTNEVLNNDAFFNTAFTARSATMFIKAAASTKTQYLYEEGDQTNPKTSEVF